LKERADREREGVAHIKGDKGGRGLPRGLSRLGERTERREGEKARESGTS